MNAERDRAQLVIALGEGAEGQRIRGLLDDAADEAGKPVGTWAREKLLLAIGEGPVDPIADVRIKGTQVTQFNLRAVAAMQNGFSNKVIALVHGQWIDLGTNDPDELMARWKRVHRSGLI